MAHQKKKLPVCANCGFKFEGTDNYCPNCGQENHDIRLPLKHHLEELFEGLFHLDSKSFRSFKKLVLHPGFLSKDYNAGKRVQFVAPFRFYIFMSFVFFFIISVKPFYNEKENKNGGLSIKFATLEDRLSTLERAKFSKEKLDSVIKFRTEISISELRGLSDKQIDSLSKAKGMSETWINKFVLHKFSKIARGEEEQFWHSILKNVSYMMFLLMPVFALVLMLTHKKRAKYYLESLVLSIHYHIFIFSFLSLVLLISKFYASATGIGILIGLLYFPVYLVFMLGNYFNQGIFLSAVKAILIDLIHLVLILIFFIGSVLISMVLI